MFQEDFQMVVKGAETKLAFLKSNRLGYFVAAMLAGMYVGLGIFLIYTIGGLVEGLPYAKVLMGASFGIALSLVIMAGSELFTGNNLSMTAGIFAGKVTWSKAIQLLVVCFIGNWVGSILVALLFVGADLPVGSVGELIAHTSAIKMNTPLVPLFIKGVLCNILVCLASWCSYRCKSESAKLIMIFWCLFAFITTGFEHGIANMTLLTVSLFAPFGENISLAGYFYNIFVVTAGNMVGGIFMISLPYCLIARKK